MAEGDTILRSARRIDRALAGKRVRVRAPGPRRPAGLPISELDGRVLERAESRGKHLLFHFEDGLALHSHLGMRGSWQLYSAGERWRRPSRQAWIALAADDIEAVNFGGSTMRIVPEAQLHRDPKLARLGPDLLAADFDPEIAETRHRERARRIKRVRKGIESAEVRPDIDPGIAAAALVAMLEEFTHRWFLEGDGPGRSAHDVVTAADTLGTLWLSAIGLAR